MKAAVRTRYVHPAQLTVQEVEKPVPGDHEVLVKVGTTTVNRSDFHVLTGKPLTMRLFTGLSRPRQIITGSDFAGSVEAAGQEVKLFKTGDRVMGFGGVFGCGSHAQYLVFPEHKGIISLPDNLAFDQAVACAEGAFYALCSVRSVKPASGQQALVIGATGAIGSSTVQLLKYYGVRVTAVCGSEHRDLVSSLGAARIIDYKKENFLLDSEKYNMIFDAIGKNSFWKCKTLLRKKGVFTSSGGIENLLYALATPLAGGKKVIFSPLANIKDGLGFIMNLVVKGSFRPVIDRSYPLERIAEAFDYVATGEKIGNVILAMDS